MFFGSQAQTRSASYSHSSGCDMRHPFLLSVIVVMSTLVTLTSTAGSCIGQPGFRAINEHQKRVVLDIYRRCAAGEGAACRKHTVFTTQVGMASPTGTGHPWYVRFRRQMVAA